jgi:hypothetical protein
MNTILILSKSILCAGGLEALRAQINTAQNQKFFGLKDLPLAHSKSAISTHGGGAEVPLRRMRQRRLKIIWGYWSIKLVFDSNLT